ncbi:protein kinase domain-containing protein [Actinomadura syzygii]|nr:protein kinase [Actinomadura syzygii]
MPLVWAAAKTRLAGGEVNSMDGPRASLSELRPDEPTRIGRYRIEAKVGEGGMGAVYLGRDPDGRAVAVKVVRSVLAGDQTFLARFHDEAANAQRVASFCTAQVLEHGEDQGLAYMVTEYIDGPSLLDHVGENGALSPGMLHGVAVGVAAALVAIHSAGLVHRDLKPSNVLLSISGPRVIDFGIARALDMASAHTRTGVVVGTPGWIAPEQIMTQQVTPAVDVFAWGCLVAYAASGRNPFGQGSFQVMAARAVHAEPEIGDLPPSLAGIVQAALRKDPLQRPSARDLLLSLVGGAGEAAVTSELGEMWTSPPAETRVAAPVVPPVAPPVTPSTAPPVAPPVETPTVPPGGDPSVTHRDVTAPAPMPMPAPAPPAPGPVTQMAAEWQREQIGQAPTMAPDGPSRRKTLILSSAAGLLVAALVAAGVYYYLDHASEPQNRANTGGGAVAGFPAGSMLVRVDTASGWPKSCHADIGRYELADRKLTTLYRGQPCAILPEPSPDHRRIAFTRRLEDGRNEAWVMNADGTGARKVTDIAGGRVAWSPNGTRLAYMGRKDGVRQIFTVTLDGSGVEQLTDDGSDKDDPMWAPSKRIVFWSKRNGPEQIYSLDPGDPGTWKRLTKDGVRSVDPEWSPGGRRVAYTRGGPDGSEIWTVDSDGGYAPVRVTSGGDDMDPGWSADGRWICYVRGAVGSPVVRAVRADGTGDQVVTPTGSTFGHPSWG